jgi:acetoin utilization protein AcuB
MADNKIGGLPVMRDGHVTGIITETDLFKIFLELLGARETGVRITALVEDKPGKLAALTDAIATKKGNFVAFGQFTGEHHGEKVVTFKVRGLSEEEVRQALKPVVKKIIDIRV